MIIPKAYGALLNAQIGNALYNCFVYGTLMAPEVLQELLGRVPEMQEPAYLPKDYSRHPVNGCVYPGVIRSNQQQQNLDVNHNHWKEDELLDNNIISDCVQGILLSNLQHSDMEILDWFEDVDVDYERTILPIFVPQKDDKRQVVEAHTYLWLKPDSKLNLEQHWDYSRFRKENLKWYLKSTVIPLRMDYEQNGLTNN